MKNNYLLLKSKSRKALESFIKYVLDVYCKGVDEHGDQIEESGREESFEHRWNKARAILSKSNKLVDSCPLRML